MSSSETVHSSDSLVLMPLEDIPGAEILALVRRGLGAGSVPRTESFWRWKHEKNPFGASRGLAAVTPDGTLAALRIFLHWRFRSQDRDVAAVRAVDTVTDPAWRRRGLFRRLTEELLYLFQGEDASFVFNTPNRFSRRGYLSMGWSEAGRVPLLLCPIRPLRLLRALAAPYRLQGLPDEASAGSGRTLDTLLSDPRLPRFLADWKRSEPERLQTPRTVEYLKWRYDPPGVRYEASWDLDRAGSGAVLILRRRQRKSLSEMSVVELLVSPDETSIARAVSMLRSPALRHETDYLVASCPSKSPETRALRRAGFLPWHLPGPRLITRPLPSPISATPHRLLGKSWHWSLGDLELF